MKIEFPKDFLWGGAVSAEQTEGNGITKKGETVFAKHFKDSPKDFWGGIGPSVTIDTTRKYKEDIQLMKKLKLNSHRTSLSWARLFPEGDYSKPNKEAVQYYHDFIDEFKKNGIELMLSIYHFDMPTYALDKGGFESREVWDEFMAYTKFIFNEYGSKVNKWTTMNEPWVPIHSSYVHGIQAPFVKDEQRAVNAAYGVVMCHTRAVRYFNDVVKAKNPNAMIGGIFDTKKVYPKDPSNEADVKAAKYLEYFQFTGLTDAAIGGKWSAGAVQWVKDMGIFPQNFKESDIEEVSHNKLDFIGLNYYAPARAQAPIGTPKNKFEKYFSVYNWPERRENKFRGWEIYPEAVYDNLKEMLTRYGKHKFMLTEYGMGVENEAQFRNKDGMIEDKYRVAFVKEHLLHLHRFMKDFDVEVIGAHMWATFDCWSWNNSFKNTYGLVEVDLKTLERRPKESAYFYKSLVENNGFDYNGEVMEDHMDFSKIKFTKSVVI